MNDLLSVFIVTVFKVHVKTSAKIFYSSSDSFAGARSAISRKPSYQGEETDKGNSL